jgi:ubiquinone/menaquinone biosynthesis C-methylase UbiE
MSADSGYRVQLWDYYDRRAQFRAQDAFGRVQQGSRHIRNALEYWHRLGVPASASELEEEDAQVREVLHSLGPATYLEVGSGPGTYTSVLPGKGCALDQSEAALRLLRSRVPGVPAIRGDALHLPLRVRSVDRVFAAHIYGILDKSGRNALLSEARRVAGELVILDSGRPAGVLAVQWQQRTSGLDQQLYRVLRRHFDAQELADEIGGQVLYAGRFYVMVASST